MLTDRDSPEEALSPEVEAALVVLIGHVEANHLRSLAIGNGRWLVRVGWDQDDHRAVLEQKHPELVAGLAATLDALVDRTAAELAQQAAGTDRR